MTTDKRAAAIAELHYVHGYGFALGQRNLDLEGDGEINESKRLLLDTFNGMRARLAALEADDGRALLIELRKWVWRNVDPADGMNNILAEIDRRLASAPEQPAPEPAAPHADDEANAGTSGKGRTDEQVQEVRRQADHLPPVFPGEQVSRRVPEIQVQRGSVATNAASGNERVEERAAPAQPYRGEPERVAHADDEARIAEWTRKAMANAVHFENERVRYPGYHLRCSQVDEAVALLRSLAAGKAKAEAELAKQTQRENEGVRIFDGIVADLRAKLAEAERERDDLREQVGDKGFSLLQQERDEAVADMLSVAQQVGICYEAEGHAPKAGPTPAILRAIAAIQRDADDAPMLRSAGVSLKFKLTEATAERDAAVVKLAEAEKRLTTAMCNVAEAEDERNDARTSCFAAKAERDAAVAKLADAEKRATDWRDGHDRVLSTCEDLKVKLRAAEQRADNAESMVIKATVRAERAEGEAKALRAERDAALAAQNARAVEELEALHNEGLVTAILSDGRSMEFIGTLSWMRRISALRAAKPEPADYADSKFGPWPGDAKPEPAAEPVPAFDILAHLQRQRDWSERTFGPGDRAKGVVAHIRKELREIEADPSDLTEWIDVAILALDGAWRSGASPQQIVDALVGKQAKNEARAWPDWRTQDPNGPIEHVRSEPAPAAADAHRWTADDAPGVDGGLILTRDDGMRLRWRQVGGVDTTGQNRMPLWVVLELKQGEQVVAEQVYKPAAADAKPGDEVLRRWIRLDGKKSPTEWLAAMSVVVDELCRRALEVRP